MTIRLMSQVCGLVVAGSLLSACANMATTGAQAFYNRHSWQKSFNDQYTTMKVSQALDRDEFKETNITISTYNNDVLLAGQVPEGWQKARAGEIAKRTAKLASVYNQLTIENPASTLTQLSDAWITTKIKAKLIASEDLDAAQVKVVTENGTVYLMGVVPPEEAAAAVELASDTDGVQRIVKIFSYVKITKKL